MSVCLSVCLSVCPVTAGVHVTEMFFSTRKYGKRKGLFSALFSRHSVLHEHAYREKTNVLRDVSLFSGRGGGGTNLLIKAPKKF